MSTLGKVLLVFNLLIGGGFAYLAARDWKGRQEITAAGLRHVVLRDGLPLGADAGDPETMPTDPEAEIRFVVEGPGGKPSETVGPPLLKAYFAPAGGGAAAGPTTTTLATADPVPTQLAEVRRVLALVKAYIDGQGDGPKRAEAAHKFLEWQAETLEERQQAQGLRAAGKGEELAARLYARFDRVLNPPKTEATAFPAPAGDEAPADTRERLNKADAYRDRTKDEPERRARLAHLLVHLDGSAAWQKRVLMVVGARRYTRTVAVQAIRLGEMTGRVRRLADDDQTRFVAAYAQLREIATADTQNLINRIDEEKRVADQERRDADAVKALETQLDDPTTGLKAQLAQVRADVGQLLARQTLTEGELFRVEREVADTLADVYRMEAELTRVERERYAKKK